MQKKNEAQFSYFFIILISSIFYFPEQNSLAITVELHQTILSAKHKRKTPLSLLFLKKKNRLVGLGIAYVTAIAFCLQYVYVGSIH